VAYGARLESVLGESPRGFESPILRAPAPPENTLPTGVLGALNWQRNHTAPSPGGTTVTTDIAAQRYELRLTPKLDLMRTTVISVLLVSVPVFGVLFFLGLRNGSWPLAVAGMVLTLAVCAIGMMLFRATFIGVTATSIEERGFWGSRITSPRAAVASVALVSVYSRGLPEPVNDLIVRDSHGVRLLRMRGAYWSIEAMRSVITSLDVTPSLPAEVMTRAEFFTSFPGAAYWFERNRWLFWAIVACVAIVGAGLLLELVRLAGLTLAA
jgi:hypothetical protein